MVIGEQAPLSHQSVQVGRRDFRAHHPEIGVSEVIGEDDQDVGLLRVTVAALRFAARAEARLGTLSRRSLATTRRAVGEQGSQQRGVLKGGALTEYAGHRFLSVRGFAAPFVSGAD